MCIKVVIENLTTPHRAYVTTLPCETIISGGKRAAINYKVV